MLDSHYLKTTLVIAPYIQFSPLVVEKVKCEHCDSVGKLKSCGWSDKYCYCHGIKFTLYIRIHESTSPIKGFYLLQRQNKCINCQSKVSAVEVIQRDVPEYVKVSYPLMFAGETIKCIYESQKALYFFLEFTSDQMCFWKRISGKYYHR